MQVENFVNKTFNNKCLYSLVFILMKINPNGFREYDARWIFEKDIDIEGITNLGKGLGTQIIGHTKK